MEEDSTRLGVRIFIITEEPLLAETNSRPSDLPRPTGPVEGWGSGPELELAGTRDPEVSSPWLDQPGGTLRNEFQAAALSLNFQLIYKVSTLLTPTKVITTVNHTFYTSATHNISIAMFIHHMQSDQ